MGNFVSTIALLGMLTLPTVVHADTFSFDLIVGGVSSTGILVTTKNGNGSDTITGASGTSITGLIDPGQFNNNDNLMFLDGPALLNSNGFALAGVIYDTDFLVDIFSTGAGAYGAYFLDNSYTGTLPVTFTVSNTTASEPSSLFLLGTGTMGLVLIVGWKRSGSKAAGA